MLPTTRQWWSKAQQQWLSVRTKTFASWSQLKAKLILFHFLPHFCQSAVSGINLNSYSQPSVWAYLPVSWWLKLEVSVWHVDMKKVLALYYTTVIPWERQLARRFHTSSPFLLDIPQDRIEFSFGRSSGPVWNDNSINLFASQYYIFRYLIPSGLPIYHN